jgi:hypothetical protein
VLNGAVSAAGRGALQREYRLLGRMGGPYLPEVYGMGRGCTAAGTEIPMFLGRWFNGYCEFHLSDGGAGKGSKSRMAVWDTDGGNFFMTDRQVAALYSRMAKILTHYYAIDTFEQIYPWHHAAGDFVVKCRSDTVTVKLITVRQYGAMIDTEGVKTDTALILESLLLFLLNMTLRMRIDRIDGVGDVAWAGDFAVEATLAGFFAELAEKPRTAMFSDAPDVCFRDYLLGCSPQDLFDRAEYLVGAYDPHAPDTAVVRRHLKDHVAQLYCVLHPG